MATIEWNTIPFSLQTPMGTFTFNTFPGLYLVESQCKARRTIRAATDPIPQGDGEIFHDRYTSGYEMKIVCQPWQDENKMMCSGQEQLVDIRDLLYGHLWSLLRPEEDNHRIVWTPTGKANRMMNAIRLLDIADPEIADDGLVTFEFTIDSPFPYAMSETQTLVNVNGTSNVQNDGNVEFWPVIKVYAGGGGCGAFQIEDDLGRLIDFDSQYSGVGIPGSGYAEIDTFKGTIFANGDGADLSGGLVAVTSEFFPILPGANSISAIGGAGFSHAEFLMNDAFA